MKRGKDTKVRADAGKGSSTGNGRKEEDGKEEDEREGGSAGETLDPGIEEKAWKRIGKATGTALVINAVLLPALLLPFVGVLLTLMIVPYIGAFVGGKWLNRSRRGEWMGAAFWFTVTWPSILALAMITTFQIIGIFEFSLGFWGMLILTFIYLFPLIFSVLGFAHGSKKGAGPVIEGEGVGEDPVEDDHTKDLRMIPGSEEE